MCKPNNVFEIIFKYFNVLFSISKLLQYLKSPKLAKLRSISIQQVFQK